VAQQRREREPDRMEIRSKRYHTAVRKRYLEYQKTFPMAVARVDAEATVQEVTESILRVVLERMRRSRSKK
jgi:thymidylate kinase